jgi:hypothetical protein
MTIFMYVKPTLRGGIDERRVQSPLVGIDERHQRSELPLAGT